MTEVSLRVGSSVWIEIRTVLRQFCYVGPEGSGVPLYPSAVGDGKDVDGNMGPESMMRYFRQVPGYSLICV